MQPPGLGVGDDKLLHGAGNTHVAEPALLLEAARSPPATCGAGTGSPPCPPGTPAETRGPWPSAGSSAARCPACSSAWASPASSAALSRNSCSGDSSSFSGSNSRPAVTSSSQVLHPRLAALAFFLAVVFDQPLASITCSVNSCRVSSVVSRIQFVDQHAGNASRAFSARPAAIARPPDGADRLPQRALPRSRATSRRPVHGLAADAARRRIHHTLEAPGHRHG